MKVPKTRKPVHLFCPDHAVNGVIDRLD
jgi:hypothetical protein